MSSTYIFFLLTILVSYPILFNSELLRTDYYESLSYPVKCLLMSHYYPSGPLFLFVKFKYKLYSFIFGYISKKSEIYIGFKRIREKCNNSIIFTTLGKDFIKLKVTIMIYLFHNYGFISLIEYKIYKDIATGHYVLWSLDDNFSLHVKFNNDMNQYLIISKCFINNIEYFPSLMQHNVKDICLITQNNKAVILTPEYGIFDTNGYFSGFKVEFYSNGKFFNSEYFPAYKCNTTKIYYNEKVRFIIDQPQFEIYFKAIHLKFFKGIYMIYHYDIKLSSAVYEYVNNVENVPTQYKKVYLVNFYIDKISCPDGTERIVYLSLDGTKYLIRQIKEVDVSLYVKKLRYISHSPNDPCNG